MTASAASIDLVSQAELARRLGVSRQYVHSLVKAGKIHIEDGGRIDFGKARVAIANQIPGREHATATTRGEEAVARPIDAMRNDRPGIKSETQMQAPEDDELASINSYNVARAVREKYNAQLAKLEYERQAGRLIETDSVLRHWMAYTANARAKLLSLPTRAAPRVFGMKTVAEIEGLLRDIVYEALNELAGDGIPEPDGSAVGAAS